MQGQPPYLERLKQAFDFRHNPTEALARTVLPTALASIALTGATNNGAEHPIPPVFSEDPQPAAEREVTVPGQEYYVPAEVANQTETGPGIKLNFSQKFASDFDALPLDEEQTDQLNELVNDFEGILHEDPSASIDININGLASNESETDSGAGDLNLGQSSDNNQSLALERADLIKEYLADRIDEKRISFIAAGHEAILDEKQIDNVDKIARRHKLSRQELITSYNDGDGLGLSTSEKRKLRKYFDNNRGAFISSEITRDSTPYIGPCDEVIRLVKEPNQTITRIEPGDDGWGIYAFPLIIPPLPRRRRKPGKPDETKEEPEPPRQQETTLPEEAVSRQRTDPEEAVPVEGKFSGSRKTRDKTPGSHLPNISAKLPGAKIPRSVRRALPYVLAAAILPFPWASKGPEREDRVVQKTCFKEETDYGETSTIYGNLASIAVYKIIQGESGWNKQLNLDDVTLPDKVTRTRRAFDRIIVDNNGNVIERHHIPEDISTISR